MISQTLLRTTYCVLCFFFYSFTASNGSEGTTAGCVVSPRSIVVHRSFRSKEARHAIKQNVHYLNSITLLTVGCPPNPTKHLLVDSFNFNFYCCRTLKYLYISTCKQELGSTPTGLSMPSRRTVDLHKH